MCVGVDHMHRQQSSGLGSVAGGRYHLERKIGAGGFGSVYVGTEGATGQQVAIKWEPSCTKDPQLLSEARIYKTLAGTHGFPTLRHIGMEARSNVLVMDLLGPSLEELFVLCGRSFGLKTCSMLADQLLERLESLHEAGYVHRDIKPGNILMGRGENAGVAFLVDFGLTKRFRKLSTQKHISFREGRGFQGTARFASVSALRGCEQGRRDDLEALGYTLAYLLRGSLPWQSGACAAQRRVHMEKLAAVRGAATAEELFGGLEGQEAFGAYFAYVRGLSFSECPDYSYLRGLFTDLLRSKGDASDFVYDWMPIMEATSLK